MQPLFLRALKAQLVLLITSMIFFTTGCEDDDHDHDHDQDHTDAEGFVLENESGTAVYKEFEGERITNNLTLSIGDTLELSVHFLDHDGDEIEHAEDEDEEEELRITGNNESIAIVEAEEHEEGGEEEHHEMAIHVIGVSAGSTDFKLELMHDDHADYTSYSNVPVTVTSGN